MDADCFTPSTCSICGLTEGEPLVHDFVDGYCSLCYSPDPYYVDLNNYGFYNMYGMNEWLQISAYDFGEGTVSVDGHGYSMWDYSFESSYVLEGELDTGEFEKSSNSDTVLIYNTVDNDSIIYDANKSWVIYERVVDMEEGYLVLKTQRNGHDRWFVPVDMIDLSYEEKDSVRYFKQMRIGVMKTYKTNIIFLVLLMILMLTGCGCEHQWVEGTCEAPEICSLCGKTRGEPTEHYFREATCESPKTCTKCGLTEGESNGHDFDEATCTTAQKCKNCTKVQGVKLGHDYEKGVCNRCGEFNDLSDEYDNVLASGYDVDDNYYELVSVEKEDYTGLEISIGIIKNYEWLLKPTTDMPFVTEENSFSGDPTAGTVYYIGNGCFLSQKAYSSSAPLSSGSFMYIAYNANNGKSYSTSDYEWSDYNKIPIPVPENLDDNYMIIGFTAHSKSTDFKILNKTDMTVKEVEIKGYVNDFQNISEGLFAVAIGDSNYPVYHFYNSSGEEKFNLSEYKTYSGQSVNFINGTCSVGIINDNDTKYIITVDKTGEVIDSVLSYQCIKTRGEPTEHYFREATCESPKTCTKCGLTEGESNGHDFDEATCTSAQKCKNCTKVQGVKLGHDYQKGVCTRCGDTNILSESCDMVLCTGYDGDDYYELVANQIDNYPKSSILVGVIKNNTWLIEPSKSSPFLNKDAWWKTSLYYEKIQDRFIYLDEGCFLMENDGIDDYDSIIYKPDTNISFEIEKSSLELYYSDDYSKIVNDNEFIAISTDWKLTLYNMSTGTSDIINGFFSDDSIRLPDVVQGISDGLFYASGDTSEWHNFDYVQYSGFFDVKGNMVIDLSGYTISGSNGYMFNQGEYTVTVKNENDVDFDITFDTKGKVIKREKR